MQPFAVIGLYGVLQFVGSAYMPVFVGPFFRGQLVCKIGLYASIYGNPLFKVFLISLQFIYHWYLWFLGLGCFQVGEELFFETVFYCCFHDYSRHC